MPDPADRPFESLSGGGSPWYGKGLRFECTRCGNCCTGEPGAVRATDEEVDAMARALEMDDEAFRGIHVRFLDDGTQVVREWSSGDCSLWDAERGCTVYAARPRQCRTWPFWRAIVASPRHWAAIARSCPGMGRGPEYTGEYILAQAADDGTSGDIPDLSEI